MDFKSFTRFGTYRRLTQPTKFIAVFKRYSILLFCSMVLLSGCSNSNNGITQSNPMTTGDIPKEISAQDTVLDPAVLAGMARGNPFHSLLVSANPVLPTAVAAVPQVPTAAIPTMDPNKMEPASLPENPLDGIELNGIIYRGNKPLAIMRMGGEKSKIVHPGEYHPSPSNPMYEVEIKKITKNAVYLRVFNPPKHFPSNYREAVLSLPSLVGYQKRSGPAVSAPAEESAGSDAPSKPGVNDPGNKSLPQVPQAVQNFLGGKTASKIDSNLNGTPTR